MTPSPPPVKKNVALHNEFFVQCNITFRARLFSAVGGFSGKSAQKKFPECLL
jgi:hypothetical protein